VPGTVLVLALTLLLAAASVVLLRAALRSLAPTRLLLAGRYAEAKVAAERMESSWMRIFPSVRVAGRYSVACALHLMGDLESSAAVLDELRGRRGANMSYAICSLQAANLVLLRRDFDRAVRLLDEAWRTHRAPEDLLLGALARHALGEEKAAAELFEAAGPTRRTGTFRLGRVILVESRDQQEAIFHALRGLYLVEVGRADEAQRDLELAAKSAFTSVYAERARALVRSQAKDVEAPSSLAPQVVAKPTEE
jgi:hypothetical protein